MGYVPIVDVHGREILDSRGNPTVEAEVVLADGATGTGIAPSGASTGEFEAHELRDTSKKRYGGKGVLEAVSNIETKLAEALIDHDGLAIASIDQIQKKIDGTANKTNMGANAMLAVSIACCRAAADSLDLPLYTFLGGIGAHILPVPMMNILNGGRHAANTVDTQEFMIMPIGAPCFAEALRMGAEVYRKLGEFLKKEGYATAVGDEGGYAPNLRSDEETLGYMIKAIEGAGYRAGKDFVLAIDAAASEWKGEEKGRYIKPKSGEHFSSEDLIDHWDRLIQAYPIWSLEDVLDEEDWEGWKRLTERLGNRVQLVGDDLFVTNPERLKRGIREACANSILIKPNQIGTISETLETIRIAQHAAYTTVISHRSGETEDTTIADLAVAVNAGQIKTGAPARTDRVAKYNRLLRIEEELGRTAVYAGFDAFPDK